MSRDFVESQIAERRRRLAAIDSERAIVLAQLNAYERVLAQAPGDFSEVVKRDVARGKQLPRVSSSWRTVLERMMAFTYFNASDVEREGRTLFNDGKLTKSLTKDGVRAQLSLYVKNGILKRRGGGQYLLTDNAREMLQPSPETNLGQT